MADVLRIGLAEAIEALRAELRAAAQGAAAHDIHFRVGSIELELHVGITKSADAKAGIRAWIVELGAEGSVSRESVQLIRVSLQAPVDEQGNPVLVGRQIEQQP